MDIRVKVIYSSKDENYLCFNHAVKRVMAGVPVEAHADDSPEGDYYMGPTGCVACNRWDQDGHVTEDINIQIDDVQVRKTDL